MIVSELRDLEIRHMMALDAVATEGTFGRAAARLGFTQSAVSQQIAALERILGGAVFDRPGGPRPVELTPLGELVLDHARDVLARVEVAADDIERFRTGGTGRIDVGTFQSVSNAIVPKVVARLRADRPDVEIRLVESHFDDELRSRLVTGELDLSFVVGHDTPGLEYRELTADPFVLIAPPGEFRPGPVSIADLDGRPMIGQTENSCQMLTENGLRAHGCEPKIVFRTNENGAVVELVRSGMGLAVMPALCVDPSDRRVSLHPLDPPVEPRVISIAWRSSRTLSPAAEHFIGLVFETCDGLLADPLVSR